MVGGGGVGGETDTMGAAELELRTSSRDDPEDRSSRDVPKDMPSITGAVIAVAVVVVVCVCSSARSEAAAAGGEASFSAARRTNP